MHALPEPQGKQYGDCAQRLSATLMDARAQQWVDHYGLCDVLNAFRRSSMSILSEVLRCSTPFGDIDGCTETVRVVFDAMAKCSTPFGDIDGCTAGLFGKSGISKMCSTPFGDIDGCTAIGLQRHCDSGWHVLNAFRRH